MGCTMWLLLAGNLLLSFLSGGTFSEASRLRGKEVTSYPDCPLTGRPPRAVSDPNSRCIDATQMTCCDACTDIRQALGLVSANFSNFVQWLGLDPTNLKLMNSYLKGTDSNMCTIFNLNFPFAGLTGSACATDIEQLACAMSCHPNGGDFIEPQEDGSFVLYVCWPFYLSIVDDCGALSLPKKLNQHVASYIGYGPQILNNVGNVAWGLSGLREFHVKFSDATGPPGCYPGPGFNAPATAACCDTLSTRSCPRDVINFTANPEFRRFANNKNADIACRVGKDFETGKNITNFSPPPLSPPSPPASPGKNSKHPPPADSQVLALVSPPPQSLQPPPSRGLMSFDLTSTQFLITFAVALLLF